MNLPSDKNNIDKLVGLWRDTYNYDVFICNEETLYCTKRDIISFIDEHLSKVQNGLYGSVIVHILTHGSKHDLFETSDHKTLSVDFVKHELVSVEEFNENSSVIKLIFYHACRGTTDFYLGGQTNDFQLNLNAVGHNKECCKCCWCVCCKKQNKPINIDTSTQVEMTSDVSHMRQSLWTSHSDSNMNDNHGMSPNSNLILIYGTISDRAMSSKGHFVKCICESFENNTKRLIKMDFVALLVEIGCNLDKYTSGAAVCTTSGFGTIRYNQIRFEIDNTKKQSILSNEIIEKQKQENNVEFIKVIPISATGDGANVVAPIDNTESPNTAYMEHMHQNILVENIEIDEIDQHGKQMLIDEIDLSKEPLETNANSGNTDHEGGLAE
eukprot:359608_1